MFRKVKFLSVPWFWCTLYISCIPLFALIYTALGPGSFYAPYAKLEQPWLEQQAQVEDLLEKTVCNNIREGGGRIAHCQIEEVKPSEEGIEFPLVLFYVTDPKYNYGSLSMVPREGLKELEVMMQIPRGRHGAWLPFEKVATRSYDLGFRPKGECVGVFQKEPVTDERVKAALSAAYSIKRCGFAGEQGMALKVGKSGFKLIDGLTTGFSGDPVNVSGNIYRMGNFSMVTIATIGYGDIIPMTPRARFCVSLESFLGLVFAGMFLNALYGQVKRQ